MDTKKMLFQLYAKGSTKEGKETSWRLSWWSHHRSLGKGRKEELLMRKSYVAAQRMKSIYLIFPGGPKNVPEELHTAFHQSVRQIF